MGSCVLTAVVACMSAVIGGAPGTVLRVFKEKDRSAMLRAYHARLCKARPIPVLGLDAWNQRRAMLVRRMMDGFGLDPRPPRVGLDITYGPRIERDDCTISRVYFQTFPGFYATAFLYMPKNTAFPTPAVLHPHGHWANWSADNVVQSRSIGLARRGYVSLAIQYEHFRDLPIGLTQRGVFLWNNIRGIDMLASLPQVDRARIGVTGASGGGMQAMDVAAMDERVHAAVVVVFPTYFHRILYRHAYGCCYYAPIGALRYTDQHETLALIAPRPTVVLAVTRDWTAASLDHEMKEVAPVFDLFPDRAGPRVPNIEGRQPHRVLTSRNGRFLAERFEGLHDYTQAMRERMYWWMDWWLRGKHEQAPLPEGPLRLETVAALRRLRLRTPKGHQWSDANLGTVMRPLSRFRAPRLGNRQDVTAHTSRLRAVLARLLGEDGMTYGQTRRSASLGTQVVAGRQVERLWFASEPDVRIPALLIRPQRAGARPCKVAVVLAPNGKNDVFVEPLRSMCASVLAQGRAVLAIDQRLRGEWAYKMCAPGGVPRITWRGNCRAWGRPEVGMAVCDIRTAIDYLATRKDCSIESLRVVGRGRSAGFAALLAAALDQRIAECVADLTHSDFTLGKHAPCIPRILRHGDVGEIAALVAPRKLDLVNVNPRTALSPCRRAYALLGAADKLTVETKEEGGNGESPVANGGFENGTKGWKCEDGAPPALFTGRADLGKACLRLVPGKTVRSDPIRVQALRESRVVLHLCKPWGVTFELCLLRGSDRFRLASDHHGRIGFEEQSYEFLTRPGERTVRIAMTVPKSKASAGSVLVDTVRVVQGKAVDLLGPDDNELLAVTSFDKVAAATDLSRRRRQDACFIPYGPGCTARVVRSEGDDRNVLHLQSGPGTYAACASPATEPLKRGGTYRLTVRARGKGRFGLCFWDIPNYLTPRRRAELTEQWQSYRLDIFVEATRQQTALPIIEITGEVFVDRMSLRRIALPGSTGNQADQTR